MADLKERFRHAYGKPPSTSMLVSIALQHLGQDVLVLNRPFPSLHLVDA
ncbi:hypothetical protein SAMN07250955_10651 [Arboricoccus pini]|uniref:Uncharacterized protein n=1 Tax=Arboricoccus pini TaxID=1963835 RepID=A0A212R6M4_9PROT|nr:hypothetical protein SAMN07250955_10651 [Arboricoccus pini]